MPLARTSLTAAAAAIAVAAISGCGASSGGGAQPAAATASEVGGVQQVTIDADSTDFRFHPSTITVHTGAVRIVLVNTDKPGQGAPHNLQVDGLPVFVPLAAAGQTTQATFTANTPGRYRFVCTIHEDRGQVGVLIVKN